MLRVLLQLLLVGGSFVSAFDYPRPCSQTSCQPGKCVWENCDEALECEGGMCKFTNCRNARCAGGLCHFHNSHNPACAGGGCHFHKPTSTLAEGYCAGGKCKVDGKDWQHTFKDKLTY